MEKTLTIKAAYNQSIITAIQARVSVRAYQPFPIPTEQKNTLVQTAEILSDKDHRYAWFESKPGDTLVERMGTYGVIKGAHNFLVGVLQKGGKRDQDTGVRFGFDFEQLILKATEFGLGTCWLGGTFNPSTFAKHIGLQSNEQIVMVSPVGFAAGSNHFLHDVSKAIAKSRVRQPWENLFFNETIDQPLSEKDADEYAQPLEMVRLSPSAVNTQPWRVVRNKDGFHFYGTQPHYYRLKKVDFLRNNDLGIAMSHFALTCFELGLAGKWSKLDAVQTLPDLTYFSTWVAA